MNTSLLFGKNISVNRGHYEGTIVNVSISEHVFAGGSRGIKKEVTLITDGGKQVKFTGFLDNFKGRIKRQWSSFCRELVNVSGCNTSDISILIDKCVGVRACIDAFELRGKKFMIDYIITNPSETAEITKRKKTIAYPYPEHLKHRSQAEEQALTIEIEHKFDALGEDDD